MSDNSAISKVTLIQKQFLCCVPIHNFQWQNIFHDFTWEDQQALIANTVDCELVLKHPIKIGYQKSFLKFMIQKWESQGSEIHDAVYSAFGRIVALPEPDPCFKHYLLQNGKTISLQENPNIISEGTTGLCSWQASIALSEWCLAHKSLLANKTILELGSGVGLTGISVALNCEPKKIYLTDCHKSVLHVLCSNVALNLRTPRPDTPNSNQTGFEVLHTETVPSCNVTIEVVKLFWEDITEKTCEFANPDLLLAADVIYDSSLFPSLINALSCFLRLQNTKEFIIACTVRNEATLEEFLSLLVNRGFVYRELDVVRQNNFIWSTECSIKIFSVKIGLCT